MANTTYVYRWTVGRVYRSAIASVPPLVLRRCIEACSASIDQDESLPRMAADTTAVRTFSASELSLCSDSGGVSETTSGYHLRNGDDVVNQRCPLRTGAPPSYNLRKSHALDGAARHDASASPAVFGVDDGGCHTLGVHALRRLMDDKSGLSV